MFKLGPSLLLLIMVLSLPFWAITLPMKQQCLSYKHNLCGSTFDKKYHTVCMYSYPVLTSDGYNGSSLKNYVLSKLTFTLFKLGEGATLDSLVFTIMQIVLFYYFVNY